MKLSEFISRSSEQIISEWEVFARSCVPAATAMDLVQRRDHIAAMLKVIAKDLDTPQTAREQSEKSIGNEDASVNSDTAANAHGTQRAASGYTPVQMISEFRALRASVLRLWAEAQREFTRTSVDEITRFNEAIDQLLAESVARYAQDVDRIKDMFLGVLGHDLRNPLGAIMMSATVMMTKEGPDWHHSASAARILSSGTRMDLLIGDLLDFTRTRLGAGMPISRTEVDLESTCRETVDEIAAFHPTRKITFNAMGALRGQFDAARIAQAVSNLVGNAVQHGSKDHLIEVMLRGEREQIVLSIRNQGHAIPKHHLKDIFDPFRQVGAAGSQVNRSSVGLGLFIVQAIVRAHGGTIDVQSSDAGTTFTINLPRSVSQESA